MMYIKYLPKPFLDDIVSNKCIPFIGAGFSKNAIVDSSLTMPLWDEMALSISKLIPDYKYVGALDAISSFEHQFTRVKLIEVLRELLYIDHARPGHAHTSFCSLPFELVCTSNFDFLLENAYATNGRACRPILDEDQLSINIPNSVITLLKFHGDIHHPSRMILTEEDYSGFVSRYPLIATYIANLLISKTAWFIGYSLEDTDFRLVWQVINDRLGKLRRPAYTIQVDASSYDVARFERRGVKVINIKSNGKEYGYILRKLFDELKEFWNNKTAEIGASIEEDFFAELVLPKGANSRLCLFITPEEFTSFYRRTIFPIAEEYGLIPFYIEDISGQKESLIAKLSALIQKAEYIIVDLSSRNTLLEYNIIAAQVSDLDKILLIKDNKLLLPSEITARRFITRPVDLFEADEFVIQIKEWLKQQGNKTRAKLSEEPIRLLRKEEFKAAVISAISLLEVKVRQDLNEENERRPINLFSMIKVELERKGMMEYYENAREWIHIRNRAVHEDYSISEEDANNIVNGVYELISNLYL